jgi:hypothetical protein
MPGYSSLFVVFWSVIEKLKNGQKKQGGKFLVNLILGVKFISKEQIQKCSTIGLVFIRSTFTTRSRAVLLSSFSLLLNTIIYIPIVRHSNRLKKVTQNP